MASCSEENDVLLIEEAQEDIWEHADSDSCTTKSQADDPSNLAEAFLQPTSDGEKRVCPRLQCDNTYHRQFLSVINAMSYYELNDEKKSDFRSNHGELQPYVWEFLASEVGHKFLSLNGRTVVHVKYHKQYRGKLKGYIGTGTLYPPDFNALETDLIGKTLNEDRFYAETPQKSVVFTNKHVLEHQDPLKNENVTVEITYKSVEDEKAEIMEFDKVSRKYSPNFMMSRNYRKTEKLDYCILKREGLSDSVDYSLGLKANKYQSGEDCLPDNGENDYLCMISHPHGYAWKQLSFGKFEQGVKRKTSCIYDIRHSVHCCPGTSGSLIYPFKIENDGTVVMFEKRRCLQIGAENTGTGLGVAVLWHNVFKNFQKQSERLFQFHILCTEFIKYERIPTKKHEAFFRNVIIKGFLENLSSNLGYEYEDYEVEYYIQKILKGTK